MAPWIISHFPRTKNYVEPCGGGASVLLRKPKSPLETYNDVDGAVVNFFRVLRDQPDELMRRIELTPWARAEYEQSREPAGDAVEAARRFWVFAWMSIGGKGSGWRSITDVASRHGVNWPSDHISIQHLRAVATRLKAVQIEQLDAVECIRRYDNADALIYVDPPYLPELRERGGRYDYEWVKVDHVRAAEALHRCRGLVVMSGYACPLYVDLYEAQGWTRRDREQQTNSGGQRIESLWLSPRTARAMGFEQP